MNHLYVAISQELSPIYMEDREGVMRSDLIVPIAIERVPLMLREYIQESLALSTNLRPTSKSKIRLLEKLNISVPEIVEIYLTEDRFL